MAPRRNHYRPVEAQGTLRLDTPGGQSLKLTADGDQLRLDMPSMKDVRSITPRSFRSRRQSVRFIANTLATHGLTLNVESSGSSVFRLGHQAKPSWLARLLGLAPAYIPLSAIRVLFRA